MTASEEQERKMKTGLQKVKLIVLMQMAHSFPSIKDKSGRMNAILKHTIMQCQRLG